MRRDINEALVAACRRFLPSIVRLALSGGINGRHCVDLIKEAYVDVVTREYGRSGRPTNIARTALLTGLSRNDVARIRYATTSENRTVVSDKKRYGLTTLLREWHANTSYVDAKGEPLVLNVNGEAPSFSTLARGFFSDVPATTVLKELADAGVVEKFADGRVRVLRDYFQTSPDNPEHAERLGGLIDDFVSTVQYNLNRTPEQESRIEIRTTEENVASRYETAFRLVLEKEATKFYQRIERWLQDKKEFETDDNDEKSRMGFGVYQISGDGRDPGT